MIDIQQQVLQSTLTEVSLHKTDTDFIADPCVICLDQITEKAVALQCGHDSFDFLCLISWLEERSTCPLCKEQVKQVKFDLQASDGPKTYESPTSSDAFVKTQPLSTEGNHDRHHYRQTRQISRLRRRPAQRSPPSPDDALIRRHVYRHQLYSLHVGSNRLSRFRDLTPQLFSRDDELITRARKWVRRELQVFEFLNLDGSHNGTTDRRASNAEFLLEYIIAILKTVDIKGSGGQAEELLREFLGRENTRLFLHELQAWLRSPFNSLADWDRAVQYDEMSSKVEATGRFYSHGNSANRQQGDLPKQKSAPSSERSTWQPPRGRVGKPHRGRDPRNSHGSRHTHGLDRRLSNGS